MAHKIISTHYTTLGSPATGLSPVINIYELNLVDPGTNPLVVTNGALTEIGVGWYRYDFLTYDPTKLYVYTIDGGNTLTADERYKIGNNESYVDDIVSKVWNAQTMDYLLAGSMGFSLTQIQTNTTTVSVTQSTIVSLLNTLLKYERNRTKIDTTTGTLTIFEDDCTTPLTVFELKDHLGNPSISEICERIPQTCV